MNALDIEGALTKNLRNLEKIIKKVEKCEKKLFQKWDNHILQIIITIKFLLMYS